MKEYLRVRWQKRWPIIAASAIMAVYGVARSLTAHDGKVAVIVISLACFDIAVILFPFRWGRERGEGD
jgi:hypothetical protein